MDKKIEKQKQKLNDIIGDAERKLMEIEEKERNEKLAHIKVDKYFSSSDGISYTAYHKVTRIGATFVETITVTIGDTIGVLINDITAKERFRKYKEIHEDAYVSAYEEALNVITKNKP